MYDYSKLEPEVMKFWEKHKIYEKAKDKNKGKKPFYFLDGPPYTSGKVHLGTAWNKALKDSVLRFKRMKGFDVWDRAGYDMHGLPTAHAVEKKLKIEGKEAIQKFGVAKFVKECEKLSTSNLKIMNNDFERLGVWMDFDNAYMSIKNEFIEGEWWMVKKAHENDRLYLGEKVMHWCYDCATALAKHELEYQNVEDDSIFIKFKVVGTENEYLIIWTTTPWTVAFNMAVMVNPEVEYVKCDVEGEKWIVAKALSGVLIQGVAGKQFTVIEEFTGDKLEGLRYEHPFEDELKHQYDKVREKSKNPDNVHTVILSTEYCDTSAGSGLVHAGPGCGPEDYEVCHGYGIAPLNTLDEQGNYSDDMGEFSGYNAKKDNSKFTEALDRRGVLIASTKVDHDYAHCWRCKNPVVYRTTKQWFFKIEDLRENMRQLNKDIKWIPDWAGSRQFDSWLENLRDNGITRQRFWGTPLPIWKCHVCGEYDVIGDAAELEKVSGKKVPKDLHIPFIDEIKYECGCGGEKSREPDILDVWIDAGSTSWNCLDFPKNTELFDKMYPPEFILEGKDQIRGWFNLLFVASMITMKKPSFKSCYMHGFINDAQGRKMSKSLGNYILPEEVVEKYGADTLRYYMIGGAAPGVDINYNFDDMKIKHKNLMILWNLHNLMVEMGKELGSVDSNIAKDLFGIEEKYMFSKLNSVIEETTRLFDEYELPEVPIKVEELFLDLSRTYIQLVRDKAATGTEDDKKTVFYTIYTVMLECLKLFAPIAPFISEKIYQNIRKEFNLEGESIHLYDWPKAFPKLVDHELEKDFEVMKLVVQSALSNREKVQLGLRWPVKELVIVTSDKDVIASVERMKDILRSQVNVKDISIMPSLPGLKLGVKADFGKIGPIFADQSPKIIAHLGTTSPETVLKHIEKEGQYTFKLDEDMVAIKKEHLIIEREVPSPYNESSFSKGYLYLNTERTDELDNEGYAREVMRRVQSLRKKAGLSKADSVVLFVKTDEDTVAGLSKWEEQIAAKVGASKLKIDSGNPAKKHEFNSVEKVKGKEFELFFDKV